MSEKYGSVYVIKNSINDKVYIGKTIQPIQDRFSQHVRRAMSTTYNVKFDNALKKHGPENFKIELLKNYNDNESLNEAEILAIKEFNSFDGGYNSTLGGDGGVSESSIEKCSIPIVCRNNNKIYKNAREVEKELGVSYKMVSNVCRGNKRTASGYVFDYHTINLDNIADFQSKRRKLSKQNTHTRVVSLDSKKIYDNFLEASEGEGISAGTISNHCYKLVKNPKYRFFNIRKSLIIGDYHCQVKNLKDSENLMKFIIQTIESKDIDSVIFLGDQTHTHAVLRLEVIDFWDRSLKLLNLLCPTYLLIGNHDMKGDNETTAADLNSMIGFNTDDVLLENIKIIDRPTEIEGILMMPFYKDESKFLEDCNIYYNKGVKQLVFAHQTFTGAQYENGFFSEEGIDPALVPQEQIISGHIHKTQFVGKCFYPGTPKWDTMSDANQDKGIWVFEFDYNKNIEKKEFISTEHIVTPIVSYEVKEGDELPELNASARNYVILEGKSAWITKTKKLLKDLAQIKVKPTDRISAVNRDNSATLETYLEKEFEPIAGVTKENIKEFLEVI